MLMFLVALGLVGLFCLAVAIRALRRKEYVWAALAFACVALLALTPIPTHAVKYDLGVATGPQTSSTSRP